MGMSEGAREHDILGCALTSVLSGDILEIVKKIDIYVQANMKVLLLLLLLEKEGFN